jgi:hypothetical protein
MFTGTYRHTQPGTLMRITLGVGFVGCLALAARGDGEFAGFAGPAVAAGVLLICLFLFHALTVTVTRDAIELRFGVGLVHKRIPVDDIVAARAVRSPWYWGWGVRGMPGGWLFNVSGFDSVEIRLGSGRRYRIGTDEPAALLRAVEAVLASQP